MKLPDEQAQKFIDEAEKDFTPASVGLEPVAWRDIDKEYGTYVYYDTYPDMPSTPLYSTADVERMQAENAELRKDAERYRWLLKFGCWLDPSDHIRAGAVLNAAIDAAMREAFKISSSEEENKLREQLAAMTQERDDIALKHQVACDTISRMQQERQERHKNCVSSAQYVAASIKDADTFNQHHEEMLQIIEQNEAQLAAYKELTK